MHMRITIWKPDGIVENIKANQGYFLVDLNHIDKNNFDIQLANISPCTPVVTRFSLQGDVYYLIKLHLLMDSCGSMRLSEDIMDVQIQMIIMTESSARARILAYMDDNRIKTALEAESHKKTAGEATIIETNKKAENKGDPNSKNPEPRLYL